MKTSVIFSRCVKRIIINQFINKCVSKFLFFFVLASPIIGCVSVELSPNKPKLKSDKMIFEIPKLPYSEIRSETGDHTWISGQTGNTLSILSECDANMESDLNQLLNDATGFIQERKELQRYEIHYNKRKALSSIVQGDVDGVPVKMRLVVFQKNNCLYTLSYGGLQSKYEIEEKYFDQFLKTFVVKK